MNMRRDDARERGGGLFVFCLFEKSGGGKRKFSRLAQEHLSPRAKATERKGAAFLAGNLQGLCKRFKGERIGARKRQGRRRRARRIEAVGAAAGVGAKLACCKLDFRSPRGCFLFRSDLLRAHSKLDLPMASHRWNLSNCAEGGGQAREGALPCARGGSEMERGNKRREKNRVKRAAATFFPLLKKSTFFG